MKYFLSLAHLAYMSSITETFTEAFSPTGLALSSSFTWSSCNIHPAARNGRSSSSSSSSSSIQKFVVPPLGLSAATEELAPGINSINEWNGEMKEKLDALREHPYFRLYSVDMLGSCEYMPQELFECYSQTCEIFPVDEEEVRLCECRLCVCVSVSI
jgi:Endoplasmic Reticulum Oxidoreductin 1 (ERO1).